MTQAITYSVAPLQGQDVITTAATPLMSYVNPYDCSGGPLAPVLRQAALSTLGLTCLIKKAASDTSGNALTITCYAGEEFTDGTTTRTLTGPGDFIELTIVAVPVDAGGDGVARWEVIGEGVDGGSGSSSALNTLGYIAPVRAATNTETLTISGGSVTSIAGTTINGVTATVGMRVLVPNAPTSTGAAGGTTLSLKPANGIYRVLAVASNISVTRVYEMGGGAAAYNPAGWRVTVTEGTSDWLGKTFVIVSPTNPAGTMTWGTTNVQWQGSLEGVTIGANTPAVSVKTATLQHSGALALTGTERPWLNQLSFYSGTLTGGGPWNVNLLSFNDQVVGGANWLFGLHVIQNAASPGTGLRNAIYGEVNVLGCGTQSQLMSQYVGVTGRATINANLGGTGTGTDSRGSLFGLWGYGAALAGTHLSAVCGAEFDTQIASGVTVDDKIGVLIVNVSTDAEHGLVEDSALLIGNQAGGQSWTTGIIFGKERSEVHWPFDSSSTLIKTAPNHGATIHAGTGIDLTSATLADAAFKAGAAPIELSQMASAPVAASGTGRLYIASDGSLHYAGPTTDTEIAPA